MSPGNSLEAVAAWRDKRRTIAAISRRGYRILCKCDSRSFRLLTEDIRPQVVSRHGASSDGLNIAAPVGSNTAPAPIDDDLRSSVEGSGECGNTPG
jgi:hypothetical protein